MKIKLLSSVLVVVASFVVLPAVYAQTTVKNLETEGVKLGDTVADMELALKKEGWVFWRKTSHKPAAGLPERIATAQYKKDGRNLEPDYMMLVFSPVTSRVVALSRSERFNVEITLSDLAKTMASKYGVPATTRGATDVSWVEKRAGKDTTPLTQCEAAAGLQLNYANALDTFANCRYAVRLAMSPAAKPQLVWRMTLNMVDFERLYDETQQLKNALRDNVDLKVPN